jgi:tRNA threonylcarbamoyladenosine biosynthesis protein TsaB
VLILALDTTTRAGSVAVVDDRGVRALVEGDVERTHGERLPGDIDRALTLAGVGPDALDLIAVARGPGAFTGLRIGLAAVQGLAMVLRVPVAGVSALDALALIAWSDPAAPSSVVAWMDAARGEVFSAYYERPPHGDEPLAPVGDPIVGPPTEVLALLPASARAALFIGDGAARYGEVIRERAAGAVIVEMPRALAPAVAALGRRLARHGGAGPPHALQPLYVRRSDAELARQRHSPA